MSEVLHFFPLMFRSSFTFLAFLLISLNQSFFFLNSEFPKPVYDSQFGILSTGLRDLWDLGGKHKWSLISMYIEV